MTRFRLPALVLTFGLAVSGAASAGLMPTMGGQLVRDTDRNITWLADANLAATQDFGVTGILSGGRMDWSTAQDWIAGMNAYDGGNGWLGISDWRLPATSNVDPNCSGAFDGGFGCTWGELGHLFYDEANAPGGTGYFVGWTYGDAGQTAKFSNVQDFDFSGTGNDKYWTGTKDTVSSVTAPQAWTFGFADGAKEPRLSSDTPHFTRFFGRVLPVSGPNSVPVPVPVPAPEPSSVALMDAGLAVLGSVLGRRRRRAN